ncbi:hypothetical protein [uncultured Mediterranean phage]|nr:hypothetical protein [uncultured Mediterranean phage]
MNSFLERPDPGDTFTVRCGLNLNVHAKHFDGYSYAEAMANADFEKCIAAMKLVANGFAVKVEINRAETIYLERRKNEYAR